MRTDEERASQQWDNLCYPPPNMPFSDETVRERFACAGGRCECELHGCHSPRSGRCQALLIPPGLDDYFLLRLIGWVDWHALGASSEHDGGPDTLENCRVLCAPCNARALSSPTT